VHLKLLPDGPHSREEEEPTSQLAAQNIGLSNTRCYEDPTPPLPTTFGQEMMLRLQAAERPLMPPGFCNVMANIGHGIPLPRLSALSMYFWLRLAPVPV
jgi:hypothetical protein